MRLPRLRIWTLMIAVAAVGLAAGGFKQTVLYQRLRVEYQREVADHSQKGLVSEMHALMATCGQQQARDGLAEVERQAERAAAVAKTEREGADRREFWAYIDGKLAEHRDYWTSYARHCDRQRAGHEAHAAYHAAMARKYQAAARQPWWSLPPDPAAPPDPASGNAPPQPPQEKLPYVF